MAWRQPATDRVSGRPVSIWIPSKKPTDWRGLAHAARARSLTANYWLIAIWSILHSFSTAKG
jgi:hypothetical protein